MGTQKLQTATVLKRVEDQKLSEKKLSRYSAIGKVKSEGWLKSKPEREAE